MIYDFIVNSSLSMNRPLPLLFFLGGLFFLASTASAQDTAALRQEISATPNSAPTILARTLKSAGPDAGTFAGPATATAIDSLGLATNKQIAAVVFAAVRAEPDSALKIVRAAVKVAPQAASDIAAAAVRAVPNPWKEVRYQRGEAPSQAATTAGTPIALANNNASPKEPDFKSPLEDAVSAVLDPAAPGDPMTLAEAIVQAAGGTSAVQTAVDSALYGHPGGLFAGDPRGTSGIGTVGNSNYANEPPLGTPTPTPNPPPRRRPSFLPPTQPNPPPVSP